MEPKVEEACLSKWLHVTALSKEQCWPVPWAGNKFLLWLLNILVLGVFVTAFDLLWLTDECQLLWLELCHEERHSLVKSIGASKTSVGFLGKPSPSILLSLSLQRLANSQIQWLNLHAFYDPFFMSYWIKWTVLKSFGVPMFRNNKEFGRDPSAIGLILLYNEESVSSPVECLASCLLQPCTDPGELSTAFTHHCYFLMNAPTHSITSFCLEETMALKWFEDLLFPIEIMDLHCLRGYQWSSAFLNFLMNVN